MGAWGNVPGCIALPIKNLGNGNADDKTPVDCPDCAKEATLQDAKAKIQEVGTKVDEHKNATTQKLDLVKTAIDNQASKLDPLVKDATVQQTNNKLDQLAKDATVQQANNKLDQLAKDATVQQTNAILSEVRDSLKGQGWAGPLNTDCPDCAKESTLQQTNAKLDGIKGGIDQGNGKLDGIKAGIDQGNAKLDGLAKDDTVKEGNGKLGEIADAVGKEGDCKTADCGEGDGGKGNGGDGDGDCPYPADDLRCSGENPWKDLIPDPIDEAPTVEDAFKTFRDTLGSGPLGPIINYQPTESAGGSCPTFTIPSSKYWESYTVDAHCQVFDSVSIIYAVMTWAWAFIGLTIRVVSDAIYMKINVLPPS